MYISDKISVAKCSPLSLPNTLVNPPTVNPTGEVACGSSVTLTCNVPGKSPSTFTREMTCSYDKGILQLGGADLECGGRCF